MCMYVCTYAELRFASSDLFGVEPPDAGSYDHDEGAVMHVIRLGSWRLKDAKLAHGRHGKTRCSREN